VDALYALLVLRHAPRAGCLVGHTRHPSACTAFAHQREGIQQLPRRRYAHSCGPTLIRGRTTQKVARCFTEALHVYALQIKPDGVHRGLVGDIIKRFERKGYKLVGIKVGTGFGLLHGLM
jgi:hypothetical protein